MRKSILPTHHEYKRYSEAFKQSVISEYQDSGCSMYYLKVKYGIRSNSTVSLWIKNSEGHRKEFYLSARKNAVIMSEEKSNDSLEVKNLKRRIKELERELEDAKLLSEAYSMMIKKAEEELKISIRKKHNTK
jgi:transposase-like protein